MIVEDYDFKLETEKGNYAEAESENITGRLDSVIIKSNKKCEIIIHFVELDIIIYHNLEYSGTNYIPIRLQTITPENELLTSGSSCYHLNNKVKIKVSGQIDTEVEVTLRII